MLLRRCGYNLPVDLEGPSDEGNYGMLLGLLLRILPAPQVCRNLVA